MKDLSKISEFDVKVEHACIYGTNVLWEAKSQWHVDRILSLIFWSAQRCIESSLAQK